MLTKNPARTKTQAKGKTKGKEMKHVPKTKAKGTTQQFHIGSRQPSSSAVKIPWATPPQPDAAVDNVQMHNPCI